MKLDKVLLFMLGGALITTSCNDLDEAEPKGNPLTKAQNLATNEVIPSRVDATFAGLFNYLGNPCIASPSKLRPDDCGAVSAAISNDAEGADLAFADNGYNWYLSADALSTRNANYANPYQRYVTPYRQIGIANQIIASFGADVSDPHSINEIAQARAIRAFDYMQLAPYFQFGYASSADKPCVPILKTGVDFSNNPRATVKEVYDSILVDLDYAINHLTKDRASKQYVNINVAYGLRARANLAMGNWAAAAADAEEAMKGYTPASIKEVSVPGFDDINAENWIWGVDITPDKITGNKNYAAPASWLSAFTGDGYSPATGNVPVINKLLYDKIPSTDVRKGWWLDEKKHSPNWENLTWNGAKGDEIADLVIENVKEPMAPYSNIKFGEVGGVGDNQNLSDFPLMRVEEMILIEAEGLLKSGNEAKAKKVLEDFVRTYRDPSYSASASGRNLADEIWFQRRVELWGEGFFTSDAKRLGKPIVRFHGDKTTNFAANFTFNIEATDGWLNMRFPQDEKDNNLGIVDNEGGKQPVPNQNPSLRDGVTD